MFPDRFAEMLDATPLVDESTPLSPEIGALCGITAEDFHGLLMDLLPRGAAWPRIPDTVLWRFWFVPADEWALIHLSDCKLLKESYPCQSETNDLLPEWLDMVGLPDECTMDWQPPPIPIQRQMICAKLSARGGQSIDYFVALAKAWGFDITIREHFPWRMGCTSLCDARPGGCAYWWQVFCPYVPTPPGAAVLECVIRRSAPAHTLVTFVYGTTPAVWDYGVWNLDSWRSPDG